MQLVSLNCIIQKYADLHHPSSCLLLIWRKKVCWLISPIGVLWIAPSKVCWLKSLTQLVSLNCIHHPYSCLLLIWKKGMLTYITHRCLWIASSKVSWLKSLTQLVSLNCIIQKYADLHHPSSCLLLTLKKVCWLTSPIGVLWIASSKVSWL